MKNAQQIQEENERLKTEITRLRGILFKYENGESVGITTSLGALKNLKGFAWAYEDLCKFVGGEERYGLEKPLSFRTIFASSRTYGAWALFQAAILIDDRRVALHFAADCLESLPDEIGEEGLNFAKAVHKYAEGNETREKVEEKFIRAVKKIFESECLVRHGSVYVKAEAVSAACSVFCEKPSGILMHAFHYTLKLETSAMFEFDSPRARALSRLLLDYLENEEIPKDGVDRLKQYETEERKIG